MSPELASLLAVMASTIDRLEQRTDSLAKLLGVEFINPMEQKLMTTMGEMTRAEADKHREESGLSIEEWADEYCGCEQHTLQRAEKELGFPFTLDGEEG